MTQLIVEAGVAEIAEEAELKAVLIQPDKIVGYDNRTGEYIVLATRSGDGWRGREQEDDVREVRVYL